MPPVTRVRPVRDVDAPCLREQFCPAGWLAGVWNGAGMHRRIFLAAAAWFVEVVEQIPDDRWGGPGLGGWNLRELAGHTVGAGFREVLASLAEPAQRCDMPSPAGYYALARTVDPAIYRAAVAASHEDARRQGAALGARPAAVVRPMLAELTAAVQAAEGSRLVRTPAGGMRVADWLATRTFELAVHGLDVAQASGVVASAPARVLGEATALAARVGVEVGDGVAVLQALTGRRTLPDGFCVL
jgi:uncharacterized protein (TIGR03083 family)